MTNFKRTWHGRAWLAILAILAVGTIAVSAQDRSPAPRAPLAAGNYETAIFAGGCFWCMEPPFDKLPGVISTTSGYIGGKLANPTYEQVSAGLTGHAEAVKIVFDPSKVSYEKLLDVFWHNIDPTVRDAQFCDHGSQYRSAIFFVDANQRKLAEASRAALEKSKPFREPIVTEITMATAFYPAEEYHQDYYQKNPLRYSYYRSRCGRDARLKELWGDRAGH